MRRGTICFGAERYLVPSLVRGLEALDRTPILDIKPVQSLIGECVDGLAAEDKVAIRHAGLEVVCHHPVGPGGGGLW